MPGALYTGVSLDLTACHTSEEAGGSGAGG